MHDAYSVSRSDPADSADVPPTNSVFSTSSVLAPRMEVKSAADMPAPPASNHDNVVAGRSIE